MKSGWIIKFNDGGKLFLSEEVYREKKANRKLMGVSVEEHWFDVKKLKQKYPWVKI